MSDLTSYSIRYPGSPPPGMPVAPGPASFDHAYFRPYEHSAKAYRAATAKIDHRLDRARADNESLLREQNIKLLHGDPEHDRLLAEVQSEISSLQALRAEIVRRLPGVEAAEARRSDSLRSRAEVLAEQKRALREKITAIYPAAASVIAELAAASLRLAPIEGKLLSELGQAVADGVLGAREIALGPVLRLHKELVLPGIERDDTAVWDKRHEVIVPGSPSGFRTFAD